MRSPRLAVRALRGLAAAGLAAVLSGAPAGLAAQRGPLPTLRPRPGLVITRSVRIQPGVYRLPAPGSPDSAAIVVRGDSILLDLRGVELVGSAPGSPPDQGAGTAIRIEGGRGVRVTGGRIRGYKTGLLAQGGRDLVLSGLDASHNWKPRLLSLAEHESLVDWLSFHHNEQGEWLRYGAGIYLDGVVGGEVRDCRVVQGMNGLLLNRSTRLRITGNDFSFNSGLGIGLYRSSDNVIVRNRLDYNVRGYSHGFYRRGQDSAALLLYEQSSGNLVAWNSATHSGDGLFLWAGQSTMDTGQGGANDNLFFQNDFSFAPTNAMEATFSRNRFIGNRAEGSDYGLWGGYSFESEVRGNCFLRNRIGLAIEHGQDNRIEGNVFLGDTTAISLWANPIEPTDWGYPKHRDTRSRDYAIRDNRFGGNRVALRLANTAGARVTGNRMTAVDSVLWARDTTGLVLEGNQSGGADQAACPQPAPPDDARLRAEEAAGGRSILSGPGARLPRSAIVVDEWGPYDGLAPKLRPVDSVRSVPLRLAVLGPPGSWRVVRRRGIGLLGPTAGRVGDTLLVAPTAGAGSGEGSGGAGEKGGADWEIELEYRGGRTVSPEGIVRQAGLPYRFSYARFEPAIDWDARFYAWADSSGLTERPEAFEAVARGAPILSRRLPRLDLEWYRPGIGELPPERWALRATGSVELPPGDYALRTISDDGIRVWVDDSLVIDRWSVHESVVDQVPLPAGRHALRVAYFQSDGWTELRVEILRSRRP